MKLGEGLFSRGELVSLCLSPFFPPVAGGRGGIVVILRGNCRV